MFHRHKWELIRTDRIPAAIDSNREAKAEGQGLFLLLDAMREHIVYVFKCECGKVKVNKQ